jgi:mannose-6-phosphate isomerase-like protein (cupin superfamily)
MKKKTMQTWLVILFIVGVIIGWLLPGDLRNFTKQISGSMLKPDVLEIPKKFGQLDMEGPYFKYTVLAETEAGSIELLRLDDKIPRHLHSNENHFAYIFKGRAKGIIGDVTAEVGPGQLIVIPAGVPHSIERIGDTPVEIILFSTPPFKKEDIVFLENK